MQFLGIEAQLEGCQSEISRFQTEASDLQVRFTSAIQKTPSYIGNPFLSLSPLSSTNLQCVIRYVDTTQSREVRDKLAKLGGYWLEKSCIDILTTFHQKKEPTLSYSREMPM